MPKLAGVNIVAILLAAVAMYLIGYVFYGLLFMEGWMAGNGFTEADFEGQSPSWMFAGFIMPLIIAFGLGWHMKQKGITQWKTAALFGLWLSLLIGVPLMMYDYVYAPQHSWELLLIDGGHTVVTFVIGSIVLSLFD